MTGCECEGAGMYLTDAGMKVCSCPAGYRRKLYLRMTNEEREKALKEAVRDERAGREAGGGR